MKQLSREEWMSLKASVADAFADLYKAECNGTLPEGQVENLQICINALNDYLERDTYDEQQEHKQISERLATTVRLWLSTHNTDIAINALQLGLRMTAETKESEDVRNELHDLVNMVYQFKKDVQNEDRR